ncbi:MAG: hypothetical protein QW512_02175 [Thermofilaceae archaeon]
MTTGLIRAFIRVVEGEGILKKRQREYHLIKRLVEVAEEGGDGHRQDALLDQRASSINQEAGGGLHELEDSREDRKRSAVCGAL